jgi:hypothetical protein
VHDEPALAGIIALADRPQAARLRMRAVGEEDSVLDTSNRSFLAGDALESLTDVRLENRLWTGLGIVEQTVRGLRARPTTTCLVDGRYRRLRQLLRSLDQPTVQAFVAQIGAGKFLQHPLDILRPCINDALHVTVFQSRCFRHAARLPASPVATEATLANTSHCVQRRSHGAQRRPPELTICV